LVTSTEPHIDVFVMPSLREVVRRLLSQGPSYLSVHTKLPGKFSWVGHISFNSDHHW